MKIDHVLRRWMSLNTTSAAQGTAASRATNGPQTCHQSLLSSISDIFILQNEMKAVVAKYHVPRNAMGDIVKRRLSHKVPRYYGQLMGLKRVNNKIVRE